jgi:NAD(P) transhydrogenase subunit alpha
MTDLTTLKAKAAELSAQAQDLAMQAGALEGVQAGAAPFMFLFTVFVLACFVGYYVVWKVTPALHTPLMSVTNAISGIIIVGAIIALGAGSEGVSGMAGFFAVMLASINIFGGFVVTQRMLGMFQKKEKAGNKA